MISLRNLIFENPSLAVFIILTIVLAIFLVIKKKMKLHDLIVLLTLIAILGILVFAKYPVIHYNYINIFLLIYCFIYFLSKINYIWSKLSMLIIGVIFLVSVYSSLTSVIYNSPQKAPGGVNAVLEQWTPFWSADIFREQLNNINSTKP
jgi:cell division protein FtsW (lipid II flippase)